jgi:hypothetical protein
MNRPAGAKEIDSGALFERIFVPGARSFSIRSSEGEFVYDSDGLLEKLSKRSEEGLIP